MAMARVLKRKTMRQWLKEKLDGGEYPGLGWINRQRGVFRVSWKHGSRRTYCLERDARVFREWATYTGRYKNGEMSNPKKWKTNFRCALNALPEFEEVREKSHKRGVGAQRVYRMKENVEKKPKIETKEVQGTDESQGVGEIVEFVDEMSTNASDVMFSLPDIAFLQEKGLAYQSFPSWFMPTVP